MREFNIPGLAIAIINKGEVVYRINFGYANLEQKIPVTDTTIFEGASMSKSVFGFFVMKYVEEGKLDLDKPLHEYLPYPDIAYDDRYKKITARMVLSHRSGFPNWRENEPDKKLRIKFEPGTDYLYSGEGYQYLAMVLKHIENTDWAGLEVAFQDKIAQPLGMEHTVFIQTPFTTKYKAEPYDENGKWIDWKKDYWNNKEEGVFGAAFSIHSEPLDFSKWMIGVMKEELLSKESYHELLKPHSNVPTDDLDISYTLGFMKFPFIFTNTYGHGGNNEGFTSFFTLNTTKDWGYVLFTNSEYGEKLGEDLFFYLLLGPYLTIPYIIRGIIKLIILAGIGILIKFIILKLAWI
nr:serine hydrolase domain-containing protein [Xanthovirga aplysinae]